MLEYSFVVAGGVDVQAKKTRVLSEGEGGRWKM